MCPVLVEWGPLTLHTYGLMVAVGFLLAYTLAKKLFRDRGVSEPLLEKLIFLVMVGGILGARLAYFVFHEEASLLSDPLSFFRIWEGGLVFFGGFLAAVGVVVWFSKKNQIPFLTITDALAAPLLLGHSIGRLGCFAAGCCFGRPTDSFVGVTFTDPQALAPLHIALHPTQLYEAFGNLALCGILLFFMRKKTKLGFPTRFYLLAYGIFRFLIEFVRDDYRGEVVGLLHPSQWIALGAIFVGIGLSVYVKKEKTN